MKAAGLINNPKRGIFVITKAVRDLLATEPEKINLKLLNTYEAYQQFRSKHKPKQKTEGIEPENEEEIKTPEEQIEEAYEIIKVKPSKNRAIGFTPSLKRADLKTKSALE